MFEAFDLLALHVTGMCTGQHGQISLLLNSHNIVIAFAISIVYM